MKKILIRMLTVLFYIIALLGIVRFKLAILFDIKLIFMVLMGTLLLTLSGFKKNISAEEMKEAAAWNAVVTAYLTTFVLLFSRFSNNSTNNLLYDVAMNCRPLLYGLIIHILMKTDIRKGKQEDKQEDKRENKGANTQDELGTSSSPEENLIRINQNLKDAGLTDREIEIAGFICSNFSNKDIGERLYISETTVKKHSSNLYKKLGLKNREQLKQYMKQELLS